MSLFPNRHTNQCAKPHTHQVHALVSYGPTTSHCTLGQCTYWIERDLAEERYAILLLQLVASSTRKDLGHLLASSCDEQTNGWLIGFAGWCTYVTAWAHKATHVFDRTQYAQSHLLAKVQLPMRNAVECNGRCTTHYRIAIDRYLFSDSSESHVLWSSDHDRAIGIGILHC
jgi:hypothetical protein